MLGKLETEIIPGKARELEEMDIRTQQLISVLHTLPRHIVTAVFCDFCVLLCGIYKHLFDAKLKIGEWLTLALHAIQQYLHQVENTSTLPCASGSRAGHTVNAFGGG